ncbi:MAG TPA: glycosyltransferase [Desulfonatronum sp.]|nr:glycosyltransferase [Desulfonatronum sp.]
MRNLFFVVNQDLGDGSAHALYCLRHCWWLAKTNSQAMVHLIHSGRLAEREALGAAGLVSAANLRVRSLPSIRKPRDGRGVTINAVFFWAMVLDLRKQQHPGDILACASFPKLFQFLCRRKGLLRDMRTVYEVHQLAALEHGPQARQTAVEREVLECADVVVTTTNALLDQVRASFPGKPTAALGLACGFDPRAAPERSGTSGEPFTLAYVGSLYEEQGVRWLLASWPEIVATAGRPLKLVVIGGPASACERLRVEYGASDNTMELRGPIPPGRLPEQLRRVDALVIPALKMGRMPYVAITKAYDYLGLNRSIVAADLPSIREVLRPGQEALLFAPGDCRDLAACIRTLVDDADLVFALTSRARERCATLSWTQRAKRWWEAVQP